MQPGHSAVTVHLPRLLLMIPMKRAPSAHGMDSFKGMAISFMLQSLMQQPYSVADGLEITEPYVIGGFLAPALSCQPRIPENVEGCHSSRSTSEEFCWN